MAYQSWSLKEWKKLHKLLSLSAIQCIHYMYILNKDYTVTYIGTEPGKGKNMGSRKHNG